MNAPKCNDEGSHYEVVSPEMVSYGWLEPPEPYRCWGAYLAKNAHMARAAAVKDPEFKDWVGEARADNKPPFAGLKVLLTRCEHGVCWGCHATDESSGCAECDAEEEASFLAEMAAAAPTEGDE